MKRGGEQFTAVHAFIDEHIFELASELQTYTNTGLLKMGRVRELAALISSLLRIPSYDALNLSQSMVKDACVDRVIATQIDVRSQKA